jgi:hypothetical protein
MEAIHMSRASNIRILIFGAVLFSVSVARGQEGHPALLDPTEHPNRKCPCLNGGTGVYWDSSYFWLGRHLMHEWKVGDERAGNPHSISCLARPSNGPYDSGYYVGGGCSHPCKAEPRYEDEGTWGWDYVGHGYIPVVDLGYWHGRRDQTGTYKVDGPKIFHHE